MTEPEQLNYYLRRTAVSLDMASKATDPRSARIHRALAVAYAAQADTARATLVKD